MDSGLGIEAKKHIQRIPRSQRSGEIIEPLLSEQWFVKMEVGSELCELLIALGHGRKSPSSCPK